MTLKWELFQSEPEPSAALQELGDEAKEPLVRALHEGTIPGKRRQNAAKRVLWSMGMRI